MNTSHRSFVVMCITGLLALPVAGFAQPGTFSVATGDDFYAPLVNPAAVAVGNARGLAVAVEYRNDGDSEMRTDPDGFSIFLSGESGSYVFQRLADTNVHSFALSLPAGSNLSFGVGASLPQFETARGLYSFGALFRPVNPLSAGGRTSYSADDDTWTHRVGLGIRPLGAAGPDLENRLTLTADLTMADGEILRPTFGLESELVNGLRGDMRFNLEAETLSINLSIALSHLRAGTRSAVDSGRVTGGEAYVHLSPNRFRSVIERRKDTWIDYSPGPAIIEQRSFPDFFPFSLIDRSITLPELLDQIAVLRDDPTVAGIVFIDHNFETSHANFKDIASALADFRSRDKEVIFFYEQTNTLNYALAAAVADEIYLHPQGSLNLVGLASVRVYLADFFRRLGVEFVALPSDEYKTGGDMFARSSMSEAERETLEALFDSLYEDLTGSIEAGRGDRLAAPAADLIDQGPYLVARHALDAGLVDALIYRDQIEERLEQRRARSRIADVSFATQMRYDWSVPPSSSIALIHAVGDIRRGESDLGNSTGADTLIRAIRTARDDSSIDGILLRIDSRGGSAIASDSIAREIALAAAEKPVVVSMGGTAASGGYYIAAPAHHIVAQPVTVTGSIGVLVVIPNIEGLSQRFDINWDSVKRGERSDFAAPYRGLTPAEIAHIRTGVDSSYQRFVEVVAEGRAMETVEVHTVARGRIWSGAQAVEHGLVDQTGGFADALEQARIRANPDRGVVLVPISGQKGIFPTEWPRRWFSAAAYRELPAEVRLIAEAMADLTAYGDEVILTRLPFTPGIEP